MASVTLNQNAYAMPVYIVGPDGQVANLISLLTRNAGRDPDSLDTDGALVPTNQGHSYTYDSSGNLVTDTVSDGTSTWVRTYTYQNGAQTTDSGWVKQ